MNIKYLTLILFLLLSISVDAQNVNNNINNNLGAMSEASISGLYQGQPDITIPIATVSDEGIDIPLNLHYSSEGVKVESRPDWVGAGWSLGSSNSITRMIKGIPDERSFWYEISTPPSGFHQDDCQSVFEDYATSPNHVDPLCHPNPCNVEKKVGFFYNYDKIDTDNISDLKDILAENMDGDNENVDLEPDAFYINVPGLSAEFYLGEDGAFHVQGRPGVKVERYGNYSVSNPSEYSDYHEQDPGYFYSRIAQPYTHMTKWQDLHLCFNYRFYNSYSLQGFKVTTENGMMYYFGNYNHPGLNNGSIDACSKNVSFIERSPFDPFISWHLTAIVEPYNENNAVFEYEKDGHEITKHRWYRYWEKDQGAFLNTINGFLEWIAQLMDGHFSLPDADGYTFRAIENVKLTNITTQNYEINFEVGDVHINHQEYYNPSKSDFESHFGVNFITGTPFFYGADLQWKDEPIPLKANNQLNKIVIKNRHTGGEIDTYNFQYSYQADKLTLDQVNRKGYNPYIFNYFYFAPEEVAGSNGSIGTDHWGYHNGLPYYTNSLNLIFGNIFDDDHYDYVLSRKTPSDKAKHGILESIIYPDHSEVSYEWENHQATKMYRRFWTQNPYPHTPISSTSIADLTQNAYPWSTLNTAYQWVLDAHITSDNKFKGGGLRIKSITKDSKCNSSPPQVTEFEYEGGFLNHHPLEYYRHKNLKIGRGVSGSAIIAPFDFWFFEYVTSSASGFRDDVFEIGYSNVKVILPNNGHTEYEFTNYDDTPDNSYLHAISGMVSVHTPYESNHVGRGLVSRKIVKNEDGETLEEESYEYERSGVSTKALQSFRIGNPVTYNYKEVQGTLYEIFHGSYLPVSKTTTLHDGNKTLAKTELYTYDDYLRLTGTSINDEFGIRTRVIVFSDRYEDPQIQQWFEDKNIISLPISISEASGNFNFSNFQMLSGDKYEFSFYTEEGIPVNYITPFVRMESTWAYIKDNLGDGTIYSEENWVELSRIKEYDTFHKDKPKVIDVIDKDVDEYFTYYQGGSSNGKLHTKALVTPGEITSTYTKSYLYWDTTGDLKRVTNHDGTSVSYEYYSSNDVVNNNYRMLKKEIDNQRGVEKEYSYNINNFGTCNAGMNKITTITFPDFGGTSMSIEKQEYFNSDGKTLQVTQVGNSNDGNTDANTYYAYDEIGRLESITNPLGDVITYEYYPNPLARIKEETNPLGWKKTYEYGLDDSSHINGYATTYEPLIKKTMTNPDGEKEITFQDKFGKEIFKQKGVEGDLATTKFNYDVKGRVTSIIPDGAPLLGYDNDMIFTFTYNGFNKVVTKKVPDKAYEEYFYNSKGQLVGMSDDNSGLFYITEYDEHGRKIRYGIGEIQDGEGVILNDQWLEEFIYQPVDDLPSTIYKGKLITSRNRVMNGNDIGDNIITTHYEYDLQDGDLIRSYGTNHLGQPFDYSYTHDAAKNVRTSTKVENGVTIVETFDFDHVNRPKSHKFSVNGEEKTISEFDYSLIDQIVNKNIGGLQNRIYTYNEAGLLTGINSSSINDSGVALPICGTTSDIFNINASSTTPLYAQKLFYEVNSPVSKKNGLVSIKHAQILGREKMTDTYSYDGYKRLTSVLTNDNLYDTHITYKDKLGNIESITRKGLVGNGVCYESVLIDDLSYEYYTGSNKLKRVRDAVSPLTRCQDYLSVPLVQSDGVYGANIKVDSDANINGTNTSFVAGELVEMNAGFSYQSNIQSQFLATIGNCPTDNAATIKQYGFNKALGDTGDYTYDEKGNMTYAPNKGFVFEYNHYGLPILAYKVGQPDTKIEWIYSGSGKKLAQITTLPSGESYRRDYLPNMELLDGTVSFIRHPQGRIVTLDNDAKQWEYFLKDNLGNVVLTFSDLDNDGHIRITNDPTQTSEVLSENHYYAFGMLKTGPWVKNNKVSQRYLFNSKLERIDDLDLAIDLTTYRSYDPTIGRWMQVDPKAVNLYDLSPYVGMNNNPISITDPDGDLPPAVFGVIAIKLLKAAVIGAAVSGGAYIFKVSVLSDHDYYGGDFLRALASGAISGLITAGLGMAMNGIPTDASFLTMKANVLKKTPNFKPYGGIPFLNYSGSSLLKRVASGWAQNTIISAAFVGKNSIFGEHKKSYRELGLWKTDLLKGFAGGLLKSFVNIGIDNIKLTSKSPFGFTIVFYPRPSHKQFLKGIASGAIDTVIDVYVFINSQKRHVENGIEDRNGTNNASLLPSPENSADATRGIDTVDELIKDRMFDATVSSFISAFLDPNG